jgi:sigma-B regulation protein RsbU (phosphoserine phosphatase)
MGAAMFMAVTRTMVRATALRDLPAHICVRHVNRVLHPESLRHMFVTLVYGILDTRTGAIEYCNAGNNPPYVIRRSGAVTTLERTGGIGLCLLGDFDYQGGCMTLEPGDSLLLYTDGVTEAIDPRREQFSEERLADHLRGLNGHTPVAMVESVLDAVQAFSEGIPQPDDITLLALQYRGSAT